MVSLQHDLTNLAMSTISKLKILKTRKSRRKPRLLRSSSQSIKAERWRIWLQRNGLERIRCDAEGLDAEGPGGQSARQFAQAHGLDVGQMFRQPEDQKNLQDQVKASLNNDHSPTGLTSGFKASPGPASEQPRPTESPTGPAVAGSATGPAGAGSPTGIAPGLKAPTPPPGAHVRQAGYTSPTGLTSDLDLKGPHSSPPAPAAPPPAPAAGPTPSAPTSGLSHGGASMGAPSLSAPSSGVPSAPTSGLTGAPSMGGGAPQPTTPGELMHSFDKGLQAGTPLPGAGAVPAPQVAPTDPQLAQATTPSAGAGVPASAQAFDSPAPITHASAPDATPAPQMMAGPAASAGPAAAPSGSLPAYASDIRPAVPAATMPAAPPSLPPSMTPGSAPVHPSAGQGSASTPAMVRQAPPPPPPSSPSALGTESVVATATGAAAGAASANATARARLQRLVATVARQQPRLAWAAGDRPDDTTVLATDLASGWIPPGIELPAAITLLPPERRRGDLETLLGEVSVAAGYSPIHHIPEEDEPVPTSPRPRHVPEIDELGWELSQATQWRDGLPRLAHTLAKAASGGTGVLEKEVDLLQTHLAAVSSRVLDSYPGNVDPHDVGNWQLLAAIDALAAGDKSSATYHLAWFQACSTTAGQLSD